MNVSFKLSKLINHYSNEKDYNNLTLNFLFSECDIKTTGTRRNIQLLYVELLRFVDNVCRKHDIDYWLGFGTLLGAVRHEGFIPWDDDIDLAILRDDYNKLMEILPQEINRFPYLKENCGLSLLLEKNVDYFNDFNSVFDVTDKNGNLNECIKLHFLQFAWLKPYVKIDFFPMDFIEENKLNELRSNFVSKKYKFHFDLLEKDINFFDELRKRRKNVGFTDSKTKYFSDTFESVFYWRIRIFEYEKTFPLKTIKFEGYNFKCPKDPDSHLKVSFGDDYMCIPNTIENHNLNSFIENQFNSKKEMDEKFYKTINYLKNINDNFNDYIE